MELLTFSAQKVSAMSSNSINKKKNFDKNIEWWSVAGSFGEIQFLSWSKIFTC